MRFTSYTAVVILAFASAQAGAVPSPQESYAVSTDAPAPPAEEPVYYPEETEDADVQKRDDRSGAQRIDKPARPFGGHYWKGLGDQTNHGPMPDDDSIDLTPYFDHPDPTVQAIASVVKRAADPDMTKNNQGVWTIQAPKVHWWEQDGDGRSEDPVVGGNPNTVTWYNSKEQGRWAKGLKAREAEADQQGPPDGQGSMWGGGQGAGQGGQGANWGGGQRGQGMGGGQGKPQGGPPGDMAGGQGGQGMGGGQGKPQSGPPGGMGGGQGGQWGGGGGRGHGPMADEQ